MKFKIGMLCVHTHNLNFVGDRRNERGR
eukprot:SAG31_NODE_49935_length_125_cov_60.461538_1_plen_27_part_10